MNGKIYVVGLGPGKESAMTLETLSALEESETIIGYDKYLELLPERFKSKELISTPMTKERKRCEICLEKAVGDKCVSMVCSGDPGVYGMAGLIFELQAKDLKYRDIEITVIPGITAALSGAAILGSPLSNDFCIISLSDLLTPKEMIEKRLRGALVGDFSIVIYNPMSTKRPESLKWACDILLSTLPKKTVCGYVENIGRIGQNSSVCCLEELRDLKLNMFTTVFIGNSQTKNINGRMVTQRGYRV